MHARVVLLDILGLMTTMALQFMDGGSIEGQLTGP